MVLAWTPLKETILLSVTAVMAIAFTIAQLVYDPLVPWSTCTVSLLLTYAPCLVYTMNLNRGVGLTIQKCLRLGSICASIIVGCALQLVIAESGLEQEWADVWLESVRAACLLYLFPLYHGLLRWRLEDYKAMTGNGSKEGGPTVPMVLPIIGVEVRVRVLDGSLVGTVLATPEIERTVAAGCLYFTLVSCTAASVAAVAACAGLQTAETTVALLSLASTVSHVMSGVRFFFADDDLPRPMMIRWVLRLFLVVLPSVLGAVGLLHARAILDLKAVVQLLNACALQPTFMASVAAIKNEESTRWRRQ